MIRRPPRSTLSSSSAASDVYKRQVQDLEQDVVGELLPATGAGGRNTEAAWRGHSNVGVPCVSDRVAQTVVARRLEGKVEAIFHSDSYGYRPGRSPEDAVEVCRWRCWKRKWGAPG